MRETVAQVVTGQKGQVVRRIPLERGSVPPGPRSATHRGRSAHQVTLPGAKMVACDLTWLRASGASASAWQSTPAELASSFVAAEPFRARMNNSAVRLGWIIIGLSPRGHGLSAGSCRFVPVVADELLQGDAGHFTH